MPRSKNWQDKCDEKIYIVFIKLIFFPIQFNQQKNLEIHAIQHHAVQMLSAKNEMV